jgi:hypothetical protein
MHDNMIATSKIKSGSQEKISLSMSWQRKKRSRAAASNNYDHVPALRLAQKRQSATKTCFAVQK